MPKNRKINTQKRGKDAKSCMKVSSRKMRRLEHDKQNTLRSLTEPVNQNYPEFVMSNKKPTFEKIDRLMLDKIKDFGNQGF